MKVAIIDDSVIARDLMAHWLGECEAVAEVHAARDGVAGLALIDSVRPDIVVLDLDMPRMNGFELLPLIAARVPRPAVLVSSRQALGGSETARRCLELGAVDILPKPGIGSPHRDAGEFRDALVARVRALAESGQTTPTRRGRPSPSTTPVGAIVIGASTGGHQAIAAFLGALGPVARAVPILIAQHMPAAFAGAFGEYLTKTTGLRVVDACDGAVVTPGRVLAARGGLNLTVSRQGRRVVAAVEPVDHPGELTPSVDKLFASAAEVWGVTTCAVVLSGMGRDGLAGARAVAEAGGTVLAQDRQSAVVWGMPGVVAEAGIARHVDSPAALARRLVGTNLVGRAA